MQPQRSQRRVCLLLSSLVHLTVSASVHLHDPTHEPSMSVGSALLCCAFDGGGDGRPLLQCHPAAAGAARRRSPAAHCHQLPHAPTAAAPQEERAARRIGATRTAANRPLLKWSLGAVGLAAAYYMWRHSEEPLPEPATQAVSAPGGSIAGGSAFAVGSWLELLSP